MADPATEAGLIAAARAGNGPAWRALYDSAFDAVRRYAHWRAGGDGHLADDAVQDAWLTAAKSLSRFDPAKGTFAAWVGGLAANAVRTRLRSARRRLVGTLESDPAAATKNLRVAETLAELPERYEAVLRAKYVEGRTVAEIAAASDETEKAVESLLTRARDAFREAYDAP